MADSFQGEWWITDSGDLIFADGDAGELNHEAVVFDHVVQALANRLMLCDAPFCDLGAMLQTDIDRQGGTEPVGFRTLVNDWGDAEARNGHPELYDDPHEEVRQAAEFTNEQWSILTDDNYDCRLWAIKELGWIRMARTDVECWSLTRKNLKLIADGIHEAYGTEFLNGRGHCAHFTIEDRWKGKVYRGLPLYLIESECPRTIMDFCLACEGV